MMDEDLKYLLVTLGIIVIVAGIHNIALGEEDVMDFGYCDTELYCAGFEAGEMCIGIEQRETQCYEPGNATESRMIESECGAKAYNFCENETISGTEWADIAEYRNRTCRDWAEQKDITLLECDQTFPAVDQWENITR